LYYSCVFFALQFLFALQFFLQREAEIIDFHEFSLIFIEFHRFSSIFIDFHRFSLIFIDFHRFS